MTSFIQETLLFIVYVFLEIFLGFSPINETPQITQKELFLPISASDSAWLSTKEKASVKHVIDGDTIELSDGRKLRYIGVDTPETVDPRKKVQCFGKEASLYNKSLVEGKEVWLEKDTSETDRYGRLLRYVYTASQSGEVIFVNNELVKEGYAFSSAYPPDIKMQSLFDEHQGIAKLQSIGLWDERVCSTESLPKKSLKK